MHAGLRCSFRFLLASHLTVYVAFAPLLQANGVPPLTTAAQVRALSEEDARRELPVRLRGVFMGEADPEGIAFVIHDETEGIYVQGPADRVALMSRGDLVEIDGVTDPGGFAPYVVARSIVKIGIGQIPAPVRVSLDELSAGHMDAKWIEVSGIVRSVELKSPSDNGSPPPGTRYPTPPSIADPQHPKVILTLASGNTRLRAQVCGQLDPAHYVDAVIRIRGLCFNLHNRNRQFLRPFVQVPCGVEWTVEKPPPELEFGGDPRPVSSLLRFEKHSDKHGHRVHVRGTVTHYQPGVALWIRDGDQSLRVQTTQNLPLQLGDEVDVIGFPARGGYSAVLEDAIYRKRRSLPAPDPEVLKDVSSALRKDADLVQLEARLVELRRFPDSVALTLDWQQTSLRAELHLPENTPTPPTWLPGSLVRVAGICSVLTDEAGPLGGLWEPRSFQLLLRSPADVSIIQTPAWWNAERVGWTLSGLLVLILAVVAAITFALRRSLREQEHRRAMAETEFTAILSERNRVAREIHDTLSQSLGAISVQLELLRTRASELSAPARQNLATAHQLAREALAQARETIWNMRSQILERGDLGQALESILRQTTEGTSMIPRMRVEGTSRRLPAVVENNLLRIGQEAIMNASKHARPQHIAVELAFEGRSVRLAVEDDGVGFSPATPPHDKRRRSFGLVGIKERAELLGGKVDITSAPGKGTRVVVVVSV